MPKVCVALDLNLREALSLVEVLSVEEVVFKVGPSLLLEGGPEVIRSIKGAGREVFLDLKVHDIPSTVVRTVLRAEELGADYLTVHTLAGREALREASRSAGRLKLIGVTVLTSHGEDYPGFLRADFGSLGDMVVYLASVAKEEGLYGVVCSAREVKAVKERTGLFTVVPGIRISKPSGDQRRVCTPGEAFRLGADMIVMGREIYGSEDPLGTLRHVLESLGS
jgi:orotidine-5'-phosphate decarboxylase